MSRKYFGTDGIRGIANRDLTPELACAVGRAAGAYLKSQRLPPAVVLGLDTRRSGPMLAAALGAGFCSAGVRVLSLGVVPTGCVSFVARTGCYGMGAMISASHNPAPDNGIKLINQDGRKLPDDVEAIIESRMEQLPDPRPEGGLVGEIVAAQEEISRYLAYLETLVPERLAGMRVVLDAAHGAAYQLAPEILRRLGAEVQTTGCQPDGMNINAEGGATKPRHLQELTRTRQPHLGVALDGDADRAIFSDAEGRLINGDRAMALWCAHWRQHGQLDPATVVGTSMSNMGFERYLLEQGIRLERTQVGDKYVSERITALGARIGGEQSGHIIFSHRGPTGDGLITALELLRVLQREQRSASAFYGAFDNWPQFLVNVTLPSRTGWRENPAVAAALAGAETMLASHGRLLVRASGTQPMVRVMVEADSFDLRDRVTSLVVDTMTSALGGEVHSRVDLTVELGD